MAADCTTGKCSFGTCVSTTCYYNLAFPASGCTRLSGKYTANSTWGGHLPSHAGDGKCGTAWNSGGHPVRWIRVDLGTTKSVRGLVVVPNSSPSPAAVTHQFQISTNGSSWVTQKIWSATIKNSGIYNIDFGNNVSARYVRVRTTKTPSWVAWTEVAVFSCQ